jgi:heme exporter protein A
VIAAPRPLWLLDEPEVGLDTANRRRLTGLIEGHRADGGVVVLASHAESVPAGMHVLDFGA